MVVEKGRTPAEPETKITGANRTSTKIYEYAP
jgi:hypothetical protein